MRVRTPSGKLGTILEVDNCGAIVRLDNATTVFVFWEDIEIIS